MRSLTVEEFTQHILMDHMGLDGLTESEIEIYFRFYMIGRQSVRW